MGEKERGTALPSPRWVKDQPSALPKSFTPHHANRCPFLSRFTHAEGICLEECKWKKSHCLLLCYTAAWSMISRGKTSRILL